MKFREYKGLDLSQINKDVLRAWDERHLFRYSLDIRADQPTFVFYEGPPSANGMPGIHHVMARAIKDIFCRYKTQKGYLVDRKAGWDTHGLPVELAVEKMLGITKEDIGKKISVEEYNHKCREEVMKYTGEWERLTRIMGYWVDMKHPYITYESNYIETLWWLLKQLYEKGLMYKGYTIQPYSPAAGTGLSTHELNQPGCYRDVKDTTCVAMFEADDESINRLNKLQQDKSYTDKPYFLAWTTTPWTLPSNTALCVGSNISYVTVRTYNPYSGEPCRVVLAKDLLGKYFPEKNKELEFDSYKTGNKNIPFIVLGECTGKQLSGLQYKQLFPWVNPGKGAFRVITGDFVTTEDGTGIVHIAPTFGADDDRVAKANGVPPLMLIDTASNRQPMVDKRGCYFDIKDLDTAFVEQYMNVALYSVFAGRWVKNEYDSHLTEKDPTLDVDLVVWLKQQGLLFKSEKYIHSYPHCWRTDKPVLYYPLDSWFIKTTACRDRLMELNDTIAWKPESTGTGRFGKWLENLQDWNLSRSRYWGTPLPIWRTDDGSESKCIGSMEELMAEIDKAMAAGVMAKNPYVHFKVGDYSKENYDKLDLHRPFIDEVVLVSDKGLPMKREADLIDVWFDSGAMPYAQVHYPFENKNGIDKGTAFPANFIAEGVDQTRGWFFTLHAIATMVFDSVSFKAVISNGLVLDKNGNKMSKRLGNGVDPFEAIEKYGADAVRWYMITNSQPWDNLKFDIEGVDEVRRKFFGTLYNTYSFFALYANVDRFVGNEEEAPVCERPEIDRWIISLLNTLVKEVDESYANYEPTRAGRLIQEFVGNNLSNWYVRLNRKRFWGGEYNKDKVAAYQTLYTCLKTIALLASPIAPFYTDQLYGDLTAAVTGECKSVHLADFPLYNEDLIDKNLEERMALAQQASSMILALRRKVNIKVRQPLTKIMIPVLEASLQQKLADVKQLILNEVNVKEMKFLTDTTGILVKKIKPNFKTLGPRYGKQMKEISVAVAGFTQQDIAGFEKEGKYSLSLASGCVNMTMEDVEITSEDIPGWLVATEGRLTVALDITVTKELQREGIARELINRIQNIRKESNFDVTDKINIVFEKHPAIEGAVTYFKDYIATQTLALSIEWGNPSNAVVIDLDDDINIRISVQKV
jgi:isoleucyl-tRNA synthetase